MFAFSQLDAEDKYTNTIVIKRNSNDDDIKVERMKGRLLNAMHNERLIREQLFVMMMMMTSSR